MHIMYVDSYVMKDIRIDYIYIMYNTLYYQWRMRVSVKQLRALREKF